MKIDAHQHFWNFDPQQHSWIDESMQAIRRDFSPADLEPVLAQHGFDGCVTVQVDQTEEETISLLKLADEHAFIKGVVGWIDLQASNIEERLEGFQQFPKLKGFRHIVQGESDPDFLKRPSFRNGIQHLQRFDYTYDILIYPHQLKAAIDFAAAFPQQKFVLDHLAKPYIKKGLIDEWHGDLKKLAALDNVWCKVSGLVTEAHWQQHKQNDFIPYIEAAIEAFGINRLMFGSDWPVCLVAAPYEKVLNIVHGVFKKFSESEQAAFFGLNASNFYKLNNT
jgi:L-fuconolactonase